MKNISRFFLYGIITEILYITFYLINPLKNLLGDHNIVLLDDRLFAFVIANLLLLTFIYLKTFREVLRKNISSFSILFFAIIFNLTLVFVWPISSTDIYSYIYISRIISHHHANPNEVTYDSFPGDELYNLINNKWSMYTASTYGPLFMIIGSRLTTIGGNSLLLNVLLFKIFFAALNVLNIFLIRNITKHNSSLFLYGWNPLLLFEFSINGHYDVLLIFFLLLSFVFLFRNTSLRSSLLIWCFLMLSILTKFFTAIFVAPYLIFSLYRLKTLSDRLKFFIGVTVLSFFLLVIFYSPFWLGLDTFTRFFEMMNINSIFASPGVLALTGVLSFFSVEHFFEWSKLLNKVIFFVLYVITLIVLIKNRVDNKKTLIFYFVILFSTFLLTFFNWLMPWYLTTLIALLSVYIGLSRKYKYSFYIILVTIYGIMHYLILR